MSFCNHLLGGLLLDDGERLMRVTAYSGIQQVTASQELVMDILSLIVAALATWQIVEIWHHGSIFANWRALVELGEGFWSRLLLCPFCLSVWVAALCVLLVFLSPVVVWVFAVARLANLGNDLTHRWCRTPGRSSQLLEEPNGPNDSPESAV